MKKMKITLWGSLALILSIFYLNMNGNHNSSMEKETTPISTTEIQQPMEATIQILLFPGDSLEVLGVDNKLVSLEDALSGTDVTYRYELGLGTLVSHNGEIILVTHDHWGPLDRLGMVQFRNAAGDPLLELDGDTYKNLIRYQDGGTMILGRSASGDRSDYFSALIWTSQANYNKRIVPVEINAGEKVLVGQEITVVRQGRNGSNAVEFINASVVSIKERWGQPVYELRNANGENIIPGDSGGGLWLGDRFVGNMWKSKFTYGFGPKPVTLLGYRI
jgi:hypothetical protein